MELNIGTKFQIKHKDLHYDKYCDAEIIGMYYSGISYNSNLNKEQLLLQQTKIIQIVVETPYNPKIIIVSEKQFLQEIEKDKQFVYDHKKYHF